MTDRRQRAKRFLHDAAASGLDIRTEIDGMVQGALSASSRRTYGSAEKLFRDIIWGESEDVSSDIYPITGEMLIIFAYVMMRVDYSSSTIKTYVAALKTRNLEYGCKLSLLEEEHLKRALKTVAKRNREGRPVNKMEPITVAEARAAMACFLPRMREVKICMLISLFAVMRAGECLSLDTSDITFKTIDHMDTVLITIKESKCDQVGRGIVTKVGCVRESTTRPCGDTLCPVHQLYQYMYLGYRSATLSTRPGSLLFNDSVNKLRLTYAVYSKRVRTLICSATARVDWTDVNTHSLRRSGAWWMWMARIPRVNRLEFGRWALDTTLEKFYLTGVTHTQSHKYAKAMVNGKYEGI